MHHRFRLPERHERLARRIYQLADQTTRTVAMTDAEMEQSLDLEHKTYTRLLRELESLGLLTFERLPYGRLATPGAAREIRVNDTCNVWPIVLAGPRAGA